MGSTPGTITAQGGRWIPAAFRSDGFLLFFGAVVLVQGIHVVEHVIQLLQVYAFGVAEERALGLLGEVVEIQGTEEWLHLGFNGVYLAALALIAAGLLRRRASFPAGAIAVFLAGALGLEAWHMAEHGVIIANVLANDGCPCPGILDARLGLSDTVLHFVYNLIAYAATLVPFAFAIRRRAR